MTFSRARGLAADAARPAGPVADGDRRRGARHAAHALGRRARLGRRRPRLQGLPAARGRLRLLGHYWYGGSYGAITYGFVYYWLAQYVPGRLIVMIAAGPLPVPFYLYQRDLWQIDDVWPAWGLALVVRCTRRTARTPSWWRSRSRWAASRCSPRRHPLWAAPAGRGRHLHQPHGVRRRGALHADRLSSRGRRLRRRYRRLRRRPGAGRRRPIRARRGRSPSPASYLNETSQLMLFLGFALAGLALAGVNAVHPRRPFVVLFLVYAALCVGSFVLPGSPLGNNIGRFFMVFGLPLLLLLRHTRLRRPFPYAELAIIPIVLFGLLQFAHRRRPLLNATERPQTTRAVLRPGARRGRGALRPGLPHPRRRAAPPLGGAATSRRPATRSRAAGTARPTPSTTTSSTRATTRTSTWPGCEHGRAVRLPARDGRSTRGAGAKRALLESSPAFAFAEQTGAWRIYRLRDAEPLLVPGRRRPEPVRATISAVGHGRIDFAVSRPGTYWLKFTWSPYWALEGGPGSVDRGLAASWTSASAGPAPTRCASRSRRPRSLDVSHPQARPVGRAGPRVQSRHALALTTRARGLRPARRPHPGGLLLRRLLQRRQARARAKDLHPRVTMQVFQKSDARRPGRHGRGARHAAPLRAAATRGPGAARVWRDGWDQLVVHALYDGDELAAWETALTIEGDYSLFAHLETVYLGVLTRRTLIGTNVRRVVEAAARQADPLLPGALRPLPGADRRRVRRPRRRGHRGHHRRAGLVVGRQGHRHRAARPHRRLRRRHRGGHAAASPTSTTPRSTSWRWSTSTTTAWPPASPAPAPLGRAAVGRPPRHERDDGRPLALGRDGPLPAHRAWRRSSCARCAGRWTTRGSRQCRSSSAAASTPSGSPLRGGRRAGRRLRRRQQPAARQHRLHRRRRAARGQALRQGGPALPPQPAAGAGDVAAAAGVSTGMDEPAQPRRAIIVVDMLVGFCRRGSL